MNNQDGQDPRHRQNPFDDGASTGDITGRFTSFAQRTEQKTAREVAEGRTRTRGVAMIVTGSLVIVFALIVAIVWYFSRHEHIPSTLILPVYCLGFGSLGLGFMEFLTRRTRESHETSLAKLDQIENGLLLLAELLPDEMKQRFYRGYAQAARDQAGRRTGTDDLTESGRRVMGSAEVVKMRRRDR